MLALIAFLGIGHWEAAQGEHEKADRTAQSAIATSAAMGGFHEDSVYILRAAVALIAGDPSAAKEACEMAVAVAAPQRVWFAKALAPMAEALLGCGELIAARRWTDEVVELAPGGHRVGALTARAIVALAQGEPDQAERDAHAALALALQTRAFLRIATTFDCLGLVAADGGDHRASARLLGVAAGIGQRTGEIRFVLQPECDAMAADSTSIGAQRLRRRVGGGCRALDRRSDRVHVMGARRTQASRQRLGFTDADRARCRQVGGRRAWEQGHCRTTFRLTTYRADPPHACVRQARPGLTHPARPEAARHV